MKVLYLTISKVKNGSIYKDLINCLVDNNHNITIVESDNTIDKTYFYKNEKISILKVKTINSYSNNMIKKGIALLSLNIVFKHYIKKFLKNEDYDLILYATPPITFANTVKYCKRKYNSKTYLMLKDIFPQNAIDLNILKKSGLKGLIYKYFKLIEKRLYLISDKIGCMSEANVKYLLENSPYLNKNKIEIFPNCVYKIKEFQRSDIFYTRYGIDKNKMIFLYGGNLGKPQGLNFLIKGIKKCIDLKDAHFVIVGKGTEKNKVNGELKDNINCTIIDYLPSDEFNELCTSADVGLICLDERFTIPNYPSRVLSYLSQKLPIFAMTDYATDIRTLIEEDAKCGKWILSKDEECFYETVKYFLNNRNLLSVMGMNGFNYLKNNFIYEKYIDLIKF